MAHPAALPPTDKTTRATMLRNAAERAVDDPVVLAKAARIVRAALARQRLTLADLEGDIVKPAELVADRS